MAPTGFAKPVTIDESQSAWTGAGCVIVVISSMIMVVGCLLQVLLDYPMPDQTGR
jgi:hypothetical protein